MIQEVWGLTEKETQSKFELGVGKERVWRVTPKMRFPSKLQEGHFVKQI